MMRNKLAVILFISLIFLLFNGCAKEATEKKIVLRYAAGAYRLYDEYRAQQSKGFVELHPGVSVEYEPIPAKGYNGKIMTEISGGTVQDVFAVFDEGSFAEFAKRKALTDLTPYIKADKDSKINEIYANLIDMYTYDGKIYALPGNANADILYYNKELFDDAGVKYPDSSWDWNTLLDASQRLGIRDEQGRVKQFGVIFYTDRLLFIKQNGGDLWDGNKTKCIINSHEAREAIQFQKDLCVRYHVSPTLGEMEQQGSSEIFLSGRAAMFYGGRWFTSLIKREKNLDWAIAPVPKGKIRASLVSAMGWAVSNQTKYPQLAYELVKFLIRPEGIKFMIDIGDSIPIRMSGEENNHFLNDPTRPMGENKIYLEAIKYGYTRKDFINSKISWDEIDNLIGLERDKFYLGQTSVEECLGNIENSLNGKIGRDER